MLHVKAMFAFVVQVVFVYGVLGQDVRPQTHMEAMRTQSKCRGGHACFAKGTDPAYAAQWETILFGEHHADAYQAQDRWSSTVITGATGAKGSPIILTYSIVPDGDGNVIHQRFNSLFGSSDVWRGLIQRSFDQWTALAGIRLVYEPNDDGQDGPGIAGVRGDVRITCTDVDGPGNTLAFAYYPDYGDINFDPAESWDESTGDYLFFRNVLTHECGHAIGLHHVFPYDESKLMEPYQSYEYDGPQDDDIRGGIYNYGDARESNNGRQTAVDMGSFSPGMVVESLALNNDDDWFLFRAGTVASLSVRATPIGSMYPLEDAGGVEHLINTQRIRAIKLEVYSVDGQVPLRVATSLLGQAVSSVPLDIAGDFLVRVTPPSTGGDLQRYKLSFATSGGSARTLSVTASGADGVEFTVSPADGVGRTGGTAPANMVFANNQSVQLTAPTEGEGLRFVGWIVDDIAQTAGLETVSVVMTKDREAVALYADAPTVSVGSDKVLVLNDMTTLTAAATGGVPPFKYEWTPVDGLSSPKSSTTNSSPRVTTNYTCRVTDSTGAFGSDIVKVEVLPALKATAGKGVVGVKGGVFSLTCTTTGGIPPYTYAWTPAEGLSGANSANASGTFTKSSTFAVTVHDSAGHTSKSTTNITVPAPVTVELGETRVIRANTTADLRAQVSGGFPPFSYSWEPAFLLTASNGPAVTANPEATTLFRVLVSDSLGQQGSDEVTIEIASPLQVTAAANPPGIAAGQQTTLTSNVTGGAPPYTYEWAPVVNVVNPLAHETVVAPIVTTTFGVNVRDSLGQTGAASVRVEVGGSAATQAPDSQQDTPGATTPTGSGCGGGPLAVIAFMIVGLQPLRRRLS